MSRNLAVTLVGALASLLTFIAGRLPEGGMSDGLRALVGLVNEGPVHDLLLLGAASLAASGFGRLFKTDSTALGLPPDGERK